MGNVRFVTRNVLTESGVLLKNGTGGGAPALIEVAPYSMANLLTADRYTLWKSTLLGSGSSPYKIDFKLPATEQLNVVGLHGFRQVFGNVVTDGAIDVEVQTGAYSAGGAWTNVATLGGFNGADRDYLQTFPEATADSVRFQISVFSGTVQFTLGKFLAGMIVDTGCRRPSDSAFSAPASRIEESTPAGPIFITELGDDGGDARLAFRSVPNALKQTLVGLRNVSGSISYLNPENEGTEVFIRGRRVVVTPRYIDLWDVDFEMGRMP